MITAWLAAVTLAFPDRLTVFAAASLKDAFIEIARAYEVEHPGTQVLLNFAGSQILSTQIANGAPADLFASASEKNLRDAGPLGDTTRTFANNRLIIVVRKGLTKLKTYKDIAQAPRIVVADRAVPAGSYTESFFTEAARVNGATWMRSVQEHIVSREADVRAVLAKVVLGEADAGIVYVSDARSARGKIKEIPLPDSLNPTARYAVALTSRSANRAGAREFIEFLFTKSSQAALTNRGFLSPLRPVDSIAFTAPFRERIVNGRIRLPFATSLPTAKVTAKSPQGNSATYAGVLVSAYLRGINGHSVKFIGANDYAKEYRIADISRRRALFVRDQDGNYRVVVPGTDPTSWVRWLRRMEIR